ncbi:hypothetical protein [Convivina praedatoris]|uniref:Lipoprotein n=1 Tax=Convivina praedatoris TaxID=2880963 RepID=A0ABM9D2Q5_9LACO|nr:hypothetical protein [Convivina sp. LMG 32447]CAH1856181.1 hypothetical protein LMG032447_01250 [Convivina sp. LMG 32447]
MKHKRTIIVSIIVITALVVGFTIFATCNHKHTTSKHETSHKSSKVSNSNSSISSSMASSSSQVSSIQAQATSQQVVQQPQSQDTEQQPVTQIQQDTANYQQLDPAQSSSTPNYLKSGDDDWVKGQREWAKAHGYDNNGNKVSGQDGANQSSATNQQES